MPEAIEADTQTAIERLWHYGKDGQTVGPVAESELARMLQEGRLGPETLLWTDSMSDWAEAGSIPTFQDLTASPAIIAPPTVLVRTMQQRAEEAHAQGIPQVRPWVRYFARTIDVWVFAFLLGLTAGIAGLVDDPPEVVMTLIVAFIWVFVEALLLSTWGTTPGKWLLKTWVCTDRGRRPSFADALSRSFSVWFLGLGFCLPLVSIVTLIVACVRLSRNGITSWDREGHFAVVHERIGAARVAVTIGLFLLFGVLTAIGRLAETL